MTSSTAAYAALTRSVHRTIRSTGHSLLPWWGWLLLVAVISTVAIAVKLLKSH